MSVSVMAIINVSPDSFSGDGVTTWQDCAERLAAALQEGADILDIGGQSTRPGAPAVSADEELARVIPAVELASSLTNKPISIDTFVPQVAEVALTLGASIVNDIHGCADEDMMRVVRDHKADVVVMHSRGTAATMSGLTDYRRGLMPELMDYFARRTGMLIDAGVARERIVIDPGIGFAKTAAQSFEVTQHLADFQQLGFRILYGASRKSFLGKALASRDGATASIAERIIATSVTSTYAMLNGVDIIRVHDVKAGVQARRIVECIRNPSAVDTPRKA